MTILSPATVLALAPLEAALGVVRRRRGPKGAAGFAPGLIVADPTGWTPATALLHGDGLDRMVHAARDHWQTTAHVAASLAWRSYTYWLAMPVVLGWATARRVPLPYPQDVLVRFGAQEPFLTVGLRRGVRMAVLSDDPLAGDQLTGIPTDPTVELVVVGEGARASRAVEEQQQLALLRASLREAHLDPLLEQIQQRVRLGTRTLLGSLASAVAYAAVRGLDASADEVARTAETVLSVLDVADLVTVEPGAAELPQVLRQT